MSSVLKNSPERPGANPSFLEAQYALSREELGEPGYMDLKDALAWTFVIDGQSHRAVDFVDLDNDSIDEVKLMNVLKTVDTNQEHELIMALYALRKVFEGKAGDQDRYRQYKALLRTQLVSPSSSPLPAETPEDVLAAGKERVGRETREKLRKEAHLNLFDRIVTSAKENPGRAALFVMGAIVAVWGISKLFSKDDSKLSGAALTAIGLGAVLGSGMGERLYDWIREKAGSTVSEEIREKGKRAMETVKEGAAGVAAKTVDYVSAKANDIVDHEEYGPLVKKIGVSNEQVRILKRVTLRDLRAQADDASGEVDLSAIDRIADDEGLDTSDNRKAAYKILAFLEKNEHAQEKFDWERRENGKFEDVGAFRDLSVDESYDLAFDKTLGDHVQDVFEWEGYSLGSPYFYLWLQGKRVQINEKVVRTLIRERAKRFGGKGDIGRFLNRMNELLGRQHLDPSETGELSDMLKRFHDVDPKFIPAEAIDGLSRGKTLPEALGNAEFDAMKKRMADYHTEMETLVKDRAKLLQNADERMATKIRQGVSKGDLDFERRELLKHVEDLDKRLSEHGKKMGLDLEERLKGVRRMVQNGVLSRHVVVEKMNDLRAVGLSVQEVPGVRTGMRGLKVGFFALAFGNLAMEGVLGKKEFKDDLTEAGLGILPVTSEIMDFKAAIMGRDHAGRELTAGDRWMRAGFGVAGTAIDVLSFFTFGQAQWARVAFLAGRGAKAGAEVGRMAKVAKVVKESKIVGKVADAYKKGAEVVGEMPAAMRTLRYARGLQKTMTYGSLGLVTYAAGKQVLDFDF